MGAGSEVLEVGCCVLQNISLVRDHPHMTSALEGVKVGNQKEDEVREVA